MHAGERGLRTVAVRASATAEWRRTSGAGLDQPKYGHGGGAARHELHRYGKELDLGPPGAYAWLAANARRFGFIKALRGGSPGTKGDG